MASLIVTTGLPCLRKPGEPPCSQLPPTNKRRGFLCRSPAPALPCTRTSDARCSPAKAQHSTSTLASAIMPFHLAIPVHDIQAARQFYGQVLGCLEGRSSKTWVDFNLYGHQLVCHQVANYCAESSANPVDGDPVPVPHFGLAMPVGDFLNLAERVRAGGIQFIIEPHIRFKGQPGEQWTMFFKDNSGNSLEFKAMTNPNNLFAKYVVKE